MSLTRTEVKAIRMSSEVVTLRSVALALNAIQSDNLDVVKFKSDMVTALRRRANEVAKDLEYLRGDDDESG